MALSSLETFGGILVFGAIRWSIMTLVAPVVIRQVQIRTVDSGSTTKIILGYQLSYE